MGKLEFNVKQAANELGVSARQVTTYRAKGWLPDRARWTREELVKCSEAVRAARKGRKPPARKPATPAEAPKASAPEASEKPAEPAPAPKPAEPAPKTSDPLDLELPVNPEAFKPGAEKAGNGGKAAATVAADDDEGALDF